MDARPWTPESLGTITGARLVENADESNASFRVYRSAGAQGNFKSVELRVPTTGSAARGGLVILDLRPGNGVFANEVQRRFGEDFEVTPPSLHAPASPSYIAYAQRWGKVSFGFGSTGNQELVRMVLDATGQ